MSATRGESVLRARMAAAAATASPGPTPEAVLAALARFHLLEGLPLRYLLPDPSLVPEESIRFFYVDPGWLDSLGAGVLAVSAAGSSGQAFVNRHLAATMAEVRRHVAGLSLDPGSASSSQPPPITGLLIRSVLVSAFPQLELRAYGVDQNGHPPPKAADPSAPEVSALQLPTLRYQLISPNLILALWSGVPAAIWIEEPHHGLRLGIQPADDQHPKPYLNTASGPVEVPFRTSDNRVVDVTQLVNQLRAVSAGGGASMQSAGLTGLLLRRPLRQVLTQKAAGGVS